jgi:MFS family permease
MWRRTLIGVGAQVWQQMLGGNIMMYYVVYVFQMANLSGNINLISSAIQYVIFLCTTVVTLMFIDRVGRRPLFIAGALLMCIMHFAVAGTMAVHGHYVTEVDGNTNLRWQITGPPSKAVIALTYLFVAVYGFTWAPAAWIYVSEIFPIKYRAKGVGLATAGNWAFNFALAFFVPPAFTNIQWKTYIIFGIFCFATLVHCFFMFPETCGKTLEEIDEMFEQNLPAWRTTHYQSRLDERIRELEKKGGGVPYDEKREHVGVSEV